MTRKIYKKLESLIPSAHKSCFEFRESIFLVLFAKIDRYVYKGKTASEAVFNFASSAFQHQDLLSDVVFGLTNPSFTRLDQQSASEVTAGHT